MILAAGCSGPDPADSGDAGPVGVSEPDLETVKRVQAELNVARRLMQQAEFDAALDAASAAIAITPDQVEPYELLSEWYVQLERHDRAIEAFQRLSAKWTHALQFLARHQAMSGDRETALATLDRCIEKDERHPGCRLERALLRQATGAFDVAVEDFRVAYELDSDPATAARLAEMLRITGAYAEIGAIVESALDDSPDSIDLLLALARQQLRDRDESAGEQTLRRVVELQPTAHIALRMLGGLLLRVGQQAEGNDQLTQADLFRDYQQTRRLLMRGLGADRDYTAALMLAELELTIGNHQDAQRWLARARAEGAPSQRLAAAQAWTWYALGDVAKGDAELARAGGENNPRANLARAGRAVRTGNPEQAGKWLRRAIANGPNERSFLQRAADVYVLIGDADSAAALRLRAATAGPP